MRTINAIGHYIKENGGFFIATRKVVRLSWMLLGKFGVSGLVVEVRNTLKTRRIQVAQIARKNSLAKLATSKEITILATPHTTYVAHMLNQSFSEAGFQVSIITSRPPMGYGTNVHIVVCPQMFSQLPQNLISFQMEQSTSSRWFTPSYLKVLRNSLVILDYSKENIRFMGQQGIPYGNIFYMPITKIPNYLDFLAVKGLRFEPTNEKTYPVLFYGDINNERRRTILYELGKRFEVKIIGNLFGRDLYAHLLKARVVVNLHYYESALLETTRICECLSLGIPVVSESASDRGDYPELESQVRFVEIGDVPGMIEAIENALDAQAAMPKVEASPDQCGEAHEKMSSFYLNRFLLAYGLIDLDALSSRVPAFPPRLITEKICLSLPETPARRDSFLSQDLPAFEIFDGLRHTQGWVGCALSYKYLIKRAQAAGLRQILICEDDVVLNREGKSAVPIIEKYLESLKGEWDIFVGLIAHVHPDAEISRVVEFDELTFVHLNKMTSMVFNIYNHTIYDLLASWDESNEDPKTNTIDRYLENTKNLRVITAIPFIAGHSEEDSSTLWGFGNESYTELIVRSKEVLQEKVSAFRKAGIKEGLTDPPLTP